MDGGGSMAIMTEYINLIVPIKVIKDKYRGGWGRCLQDHAELIGGRVWYDDYLFRDGAMNPMEMKSLIEEWEKMGFTLFDEKDGKRFWKDVCVYETMLGDRTIRCEWLEVDAKSTAVSLKGAPPSKLAGRNIV